MRRRAVALGVALAAFLGAGGVAYAAFRATSANPQTVSAGTLALSSSPSGAVFSLTGLRPGGAAVTRCVAVTQTGQPSTTVRLYGSSSGALASLLDVTVTRGTQSGPPSASCNGFSADTPSYTGAGAGVVFSGRLSAYPANWDAGIVDAPGATETWTTGETHSYRIAVQVPSSVSGAAAQGLSSSATFTWEAQ